jgi:hypothetical protein
MSAHGLISIDFSGSNNWKLTLTPLGAEVIEEADRSKAGNRRPGVHVTNLTVVF